MARYKIISEHGAYMPRSSEVVRLELGADSAAARVYGIRAQVCELLAEGAEVEGAHVVFGPHLEPLDDEAREQAAIYWQAHPNATLDPTRSLPLGRDPLVVATFETATLGMLERMAAEAAGTATPNDAKLDALTEAMTKLAGIVGSLATPPAPAQRTR